MLLENPAPRAATPAGDRTGPSDWTRRSVIVGLGATIGAGAVSAPGVAAGQPVMRSLAAYDHKTLE